MSHKGQQRTFRRVIDIISAGCRKFGVPKELLMGPASKYTSRENAALWPINHKTEDNCGSKSDGWSSKGGREMHTNLIIRPPSYFRRMAHTISIHSQIKPIWNADRTGD